MKMFLALILASVSLAEAVTFGPLARPTVTTYAQTNLDTVYYTNVVNGVTNYTWDFEPGSAAKASYNAIAAWCNAATNYEYSAGFWLADYTGWKSVSLTSYVSGAQSPITIVSPRHGLAVGHYIYPPDSAWVGRDIVVHIAGVNYTNKVEAITNDYWGWPQYDIVANDINLWWFTANAGHDVCVILFSNEWNAAVAPVKFLPTNFANYFPSYAQGVNVNPRLPVTTVFGQPGPYNRGAIALKNRNLAGLINYTNCPNWGFYGTTGNTHPGGSSGTPAFIPLAGGQVAYFGLVNGINSIPDQENTVLHFGVPGSPNTSNPWTNSVQMLMNALSTRQGAPFYTLERVDMSQYKLYP